MAHFAQLDANNIVREIVVVNNNVITDENNVEQESLGVAFCKQLYGADTNWKQTSYNENFRVRYAKIGGYYHEESNAFLDNPQPYPSWTLNLNTHFWVSPVNHPWSVDRKNFANLYEWDEENLNWKQTGSNPTITAMHATI